MQFGPAISLSPSFDSYSSNKLAEIAARVVEELRAESESEIDDLFGLGTETEEGFKVEDEVNKNGEDEEDEEDSDEFEFAFVCEVPESSPISADEIFYNGQIRPVFPIFNRDLLFGEAENEISDSSTKSATPKPVRFPLRKLFIEERDSPSCSSSEADELDGILPGTYCVWTPKSKTAYSQESCKKSNSTGSSKRWKFRDFLNRSNSDGKETFVFLTPTNVNPNKKSENVVKATSEVPKVAGKAKAKGVAGGGDGVKNLAAEYMRKKEENKRRSFLPYRQDLVGFFANVNGLSRNLHPF